MSICLMSLMRRRRRLIFPYWINNEMKYLNLNAHQVIQRHSNRDIVYTIRDIHVYQKRPY